MSRRPDGGSKTVSFDHCIIAAGSQVARIPGFPYDDSALMDSTGALELAEIPKRMLVIGGGIIGLEMATVYDALGSKITVVELLDGLIPGADRDIVRPLHKRIEKRYEAILLKTKVTKLEAQKEGLRATFEGEGAPAPQVYDRVLMAVGRRPNGREIDAENAGVTVNERGFIPVDKQQRTNVPHIYAIGDIVGEPMLAHKATHEGKLAAEVIAGHKAAFDARTIPSVAYTDPEIAWMGLTETQAKAQGIEIEKASFPWAASGRALATGRDEGMTKLIFDKSTRRLLGAAMVGPERRRTDRRDRAGAGDGRRRAGHRAHHPSASDAVRDRVLRRRDRRGQHHRPLHAQTLMQGEIVRPVAHATRGAAERGVVVRVPGHDAAGAQDRGSRAPAVRRASLEPRPRTPALAVPRHPRAAHVYSAECGETVEPPEEMTWAGLRSLFGAIDDRPSRSRAARSRSWTGIARTSSAVAAARRPSARPANARASARAAARPTIRASRRS